MRCSNALVSPQIAGALVIAVTLVLVSVFSKDSLSPGVVAAMAGAYVIVMPRQRCRLSGKRAAGGAG